MNYGQLYPIPNSDLNCAAGLSKPEAIAVRAYMSKIRPQYDVVVNGLAEYLNRNQRAIFGGVTEPGRQNLGNAFRIASKECFIKAILDVNVALHSQNFVWRADQRELMGFIKTQSVRNVSEWSKFVWDPAQLPPESRLLVSTSRFVGDSSSIPGSMSSSWPNWPPLTVDLALERHDTWILNQTFRSPRKRFVDMA